MGPDRRKHYGGGKAGVKRIVGIGEGVEMSGRSSMVRTVATVSPSCSSTTDSSRPEERARSTPTCPEQPRRCGGRR